MNGAWIICHSSAPIYQLCFSLRPSLNFHPTCWRRVMTDQPTFLYRAFSQSIFLGAVLLTCAALSFAQGGAGGGANNPNNPGRGAGVSHSIRGKIFMPS